MALVNEHFLKLPGSYLFSDIAKKVNTFKITHPKQDLVRLGIGDVTRPLPPACIEAMHKAVDEMGHAETFHGYAPDLGYEFLRSAMAKNDYQDRGCDIRADEIFISDFDGHNPQQVTRDGSLIRALTWGPDKSSLFYCSYSTQCYLTTISYQNGINLSL